MTAAVAPTLDRLPTAAVTPSGGRGRLEPGWPLIVLFAGIPLWWVLGVFQIAFFVLAIPMLLYLLRRRRVVVPDGFGGWLLLLLWVLGGILVLQVDAPGAIPGSSPARFLTFGFRFGWYLCGTIALLYVVNTANILRSDRIAYALGWMFVALVGGGLLSSLIPTLEFKTPVELLLPGALSSNEFVQSLVHAQVAQLQDFLGSVEPRASAPFPFANQWGIAMAATAPHFVAGWWSQGGIYRRLTPVIAAISIVPIISSLNRGMWAAFIVMVVYAFARSGLHRRPGLLAGATGALVLAATVIWMSPLGSLIMQRLNTPHSNEGRGNLSTLTVTSALAGSPIIGFGTTREVQGNFNSISAGSTASCPACSPPPLGTQGNLWELIFGAGFVGLLLYLAFMISQLTRYARITTPLAIASQCTILAVLVTSPVYNLVHPVIVVVLVAVGILVRQGPEPTRELALLVRPVRRGLPLIVAFAAVGGLLGGLVQLDRGTSAVASQRVLVPQVDLVGVPSARVLTLDSEALLVTSDSVLTEAAEQSNVDEESLASRVTVAAQPNTQILVIRVRAATPAAASEQATAVAEAYLDLRGEMADAAREQNRERLESQLQALGTAVAAADAGLGEDDSPNPVLVQTAETLRLQSGLVAAAIADTEGELNVGRLLGQPRVATPLDPWIISVGSGGMLGLLIGICLAWVTDGRIRLLHAFGRVGSDLPIVDRVPTQVGQVPERAAERAAHVVGVYQPLAGVLADMKVPLARELAARLDRGLRVPVGRGGDRVLIVTTRRSPAAHLERTRRTADQSGLNPVGVILVDD